MKVKAQDESLRVERERFDILVQAVQDYAIFALDPKGLVKSWNAGAERFKGYRAHEILGKHFSIFYPEDLKQTKFPDYELEQARLTGRFEHEGLRIRKDGTSFLAHVTITAIYDRNKNLTGFLKVTRDMTESKKLEETLRKLNSELESRVNARTAELFQRERELKEAKEVAEAASVAKSNFLANMSHEIRTPLGAILGFSELLADDEVSGEEKNMARDAVKRNGQLLTDLINDILDLSKVEANRLELDISSVTLKQLATEIQTTFKLRAENKGIQFNLEIAPHLPPRILTDSLRVKQILFNIVGNAVKFTREGSVNVKIYGGQGKLFFDVTDTGVGISPDQERLLFVPFQQADPSITRQFGGTGLGLILSKRLAQALGGDLILAQSDLGLGTTFTVSISLRPDDQITYSENSDGWVLEKELFQGKRILIVDDNPDNRLLITRLFKPLAVEIESASDGRSGIDKALSWNPDLVLMDLQMPLMGGIAATEELRRSHFRQPIIALTAHAMKEEKDRCLALGFDAYITKPIEKGVFFSTLSKFLRETVPS
ncbi:hypothetical protein AZI86_15935 [Bdellovibrio bacteriovorus]|uniref:histidine kinase n=1 Tax=Bdellovibrio bacteriovorus TaxID=959 RepID=A0A150WHN3_BDEBC|nr:response regulator [Bdellovibrio bacteriovorus]KYG63192.1 hypothetical protein AZI86_15935 [Bdellovibrio bacteriovorus]